MRRRIVLVAVVAALLATALFGLPLAIGVSQFFLDRERGDLERTAQAAAVGAAADLARRQVPSSLDGGDDGVTLGLYREEDGSLIAGQRAPRSADAVVAGALRGKVTSKDDVRGSLVVAVPVTDGHRGVKGAVVVSTGYAEVRWQIVGTWAVMLALALAALAVALALAQRQARRLAAPLEELSSAAQRLGDGDFSVRAATSGIREIDAVSASLGATAGRLGVLVRQERDLAAHASHQLRTPLTALRLVLESALDQGPEVRQEAVATALEAADRLERTIADLLHLAHDERAQDRRSLPSADLVALVHDAAVAARTGLGPAGRTLAVVVQDGLPAAAASSAAVRQVLGVLLDNATVHGGGAVTITVRDAGGALALDVTDEGEGVRDPGVLFSARPSPRPGQGDGSGIGLGLARTLAEGQGGRLVLSRVRPPVFTLLLPAEEPAALPS